MSRPLTDEELVHERLGDRNATALSSYDTNRRVEVLIDELLPDELVRDRRVLDVGCGLGFFSRRLVERGARVIACDIGPSLVERTKALAGCEGRVVDALELSRSFGAEFDVVVSSECIEHTPDPARAIREMASVLKPGGHLALSTPNLWWWPTVALATRLHLRPYDGHENFSTWRSLRRALRAAGLEPIAERGVHLFPFQISAHQLSRWCDTHLQSLRELMINLAVLAKRT